jgi:tol-pal system protein YbgF
MRFLISDRFNVRLGLGYGQLSDGFSKRTFYTTVFNADLKAHLYVIKSGVFRPYAALGFGAINYTYQKDRPRLPTDRDDPALVGKTLWDVAFIFGGGADLMLSQKFALNAMADYRHTTTDGLDGILAGTGKDGYLNARLGLVMFFGHRDDKELEQDLLADDSVSEQVESTPADTAPAQPTEDDETADILALLMGTQDDEEVPEQETPTEADTLGPEQRLEELRSKIKNVETEITSMEQQISEKDARIAELQRELKQLESLPSDFSATYKEALRLYSVRQHDRSIAMFKSLLNAHPRHKLASNCTYWIGENYFLKRNYDLAIDAFNAVFNYEFSYKFDDATLMLGRCYHKLGQINQAISYFEELINEYPDSEYVSKARQWISRIQ